MTMLLGSVVVVVVVVVVVLVVVVEVVPKRRAPTSGMVVGPAVVLGAAIENGESSTLRGEPSKPGEAALSTLTS